jgi:phage tail sheath protein FI
MPNALSYPGVYVEEISSGVRAIAGVATSITAFVGRARKGPVDEAVEITSFADFERQFGGLWLDSAMSFAVRDFFLNGGSRAVIVRLFHPAFESAEVRDAAVAAAAKIASEAAAGANGAQAKAKAAAALATINNDANAKPAVKQAATSANAVIAALDDNADAAAVQAAAAQAKDAAGPADLRRLSVGSLQFEAANPGSWAGYLRIQVAAPAAAQDASARLGVAASDLFQLTVTDAAPGGVSEIYLNLTLRNSARRVDKVLARESMLIRWSSAIDLDQPPPALPDFSTVNGDEVGAAWAALADARKNNPDPTADAVKTAQAQYDAMLGAALKSVADGGLLAAADFLPAGAQADKRGLFALEDLYARDGLFNLLCIPPYLDDGGVDVNVIATAAAYCEQRRAMLIVDSPPGWGSIAAASSGFSAEPDQVGARSRNAALFFPRLNMANPLREGQIEAFAPCGVVAGIFARTDAQRGVWKSPAGLDAVMVGVSSLSVPMTDEENGILNPLGINCLRSFPVFGRVLWGARTLRGADGFADEYKYTAVRRTALFIEESLYRALKWVVFEPNDEPLWAQIRLNVGAFMQNLFRQGAFQGASAREAFFVRCDASTTTQNDINLGIVNIDVGFAPLKPAEFVVIKLQQIAGQIET